ncbi:MAG: RMD1 family protein [Chloroflexi bacterium]|nr:RMD1 family protein [Chloroflexota bacterium]
MARFSGLKGFVQLSTVEELRDKASKLLLLARKHPKEADILSSCASVVLATALDQGINDVLYSIAAQYANENETLIDETPYEKNINDTFRNRMLDLPEVLSGGKFTLNKQSQYIKQINTLISLRNRLMHIIDDPEFFTESSEGVEIIGTKLFIKMEMPKSPWLTISSEEAYKYFEAVDIYFQEIIFPETGEIQEGKLVIPKR